MQTDDPVAQVAQSDTIPPERLLEAAWVLIANAGGGDWDSATGEWREAAIRWRNSYHGVLYPIAAPAQPDQEDDWKAQYERACQTIAAMHAAAVGEVRGADRGVVEDVADLRARCLAAEEALADLLPSDSESADEDPLTAGAWVILELLGHRRVAGYALQAMVAGKPMIRVDIPETLASPARTQFFAPGALYALHPVDEAAARAAVKAVGVAAPVTRWELEQAAARLTTDQDGDDQDGVDSWG